jgi:histone-lysine N-methyltransferase SUV39H
LITVDESEERGKKYDEEGVTYLFDLDYNEDEMEDCKYTLDATHYGNVAHFINHSVSFIIKLFNVSCNKLLSSTSIYVLSCLPKV